MREPRNPFSMRTSEHIESDDTFLRLFGPGVLEMLPKDNLLEKVQIFLSAPGGGKTSLFRLFTPNVLQTLHRSRNIDDYKDIYQRLKALDIVSEDGPSILGIMLSCAKNYAVIDDISMDQGRKDRLLFSLLNSRIILSMLQGALVLNNLHYPEDLDKIKIHSNTVDIPTTIPLLGTGYQLYEWACSVEQKVCELIDSFNPHDVSIEGSSTLDVLSILNPKNILIDNCPIVKYVLLMFDNVQKLTESQRKILMASLFDIRPPCGIWIAERLEALRPDEMLAPGSTTGREYGEPVILEKYWKTSKHFENIIKNIADRRSRLNPDANIGPFAGCLEDTIDSREYNIKFSEAIEVIRNRINSNYSGNQRYEKWIKSREELVGSVHQLAIEWRKLEILIARDLRRGQMIFDFALEEEEGNSSSSLKAAAEYFLYHEFNIPYYYGMTRLTNLASFNIEQFLSFSEDIFEEIISKTLIRERPQLSPTRQEAILKKAIQQRWQELPRKIQKGRETQKLLEAIYNFAKTETLRPNAPYAPGVTGIAISMDDRDKLIKGMSTNRVYNSLALVLSSCISNNLLEVSLDRAQGKKGLTWMVLYLNRWLCLKFNLPLQYGGWRQKSLSELCKWLDV